MRLLSEDTTRKEALAVMRRALADSGIASAALDARLLMAQALGIGLAELLTRDDIAVGADGAAALDAAITRRLTGESVARIIGSREFWGLPFRLSADTLEPRPDTETLIEAVLAACPDRQAPLRFLDLGTGTGCILIALLSEFPHATGIGADISPGALAMAAENAGINSVGARAEFVRSDWFGNITGAFDIIVSNPPYIRSDVIATLDREVRDHDPARALDGGPDGLDAYRRILAGCKEHLKPGGKVFFEIGFDQNPAIETLSREAGFAEVAVRNDLAGHVRVTMLSCPAKKVESPLVDRRRTR